MRGRASYLSRLWDFASTVLPTWLGVRVPFSLDWLPGPVLGTAVVIVALAGFVWLVRLRPRRLEPVLVVGLLFPFLYAITSYTYYVDDPRYLVFLAPVTALLRGRLAATHRAVGVVVFGAAFTLSVAGLVRMEQQGLFRPGVAAARVPTNMEPLIRTLEAHNATRAFAGYWIAHRLSFESRERIIAASTGFSRYTRGGTRSSARARTRLTCTSPARRTSGEPVRGSWARATSAIPPAASSRTCTPSRPGAEIA